MIWRLRIWRLGLVGNYLVGMPYHPAYILGLHMCNSALLLRCEHLCLSPRRASSQRPYTPTHALTGAKGGADGHAGHWAWMPHQGLDYGRVLLCHTPVPTPPPWTGGGPMDCLHLSLTVHRTFSPACHHHATTTTISTILTLTFLNMMGEGEGREDQFSPTWDIPIVLFSPQCGGTG